MATSIPAVQGDHISSCLLINLTLGATTYYITSAYKPVTYDGNTYTELGSLLQVSSVQEDIRATNGDISVTLCGIPSEQNYLSLILTTPIKGGEIEVYRGFYNTITHELDTSEVYLRFSGIITNFAIQEDFTATKTLTNSVTVTCASINSLLETRISGQRTNPDDRARLYPNDLVFSRVPELYNISFDFGKEYTSGGGGYGGGGGGGCFVKDTLITMADGTFKTIQTVKLGDKVVSYNFITELMDISTVKEITKPLVNNIVRLKIGNTVLKCTPDHPIYIQGKGWCSLSPDETKANHNLDVKTYEIGDTCVLDSEHGARHDEVSQATIEHIETQYKENTQTYNLSKVLDNHNFFANGILVHNKRDGGGNQRNISQA